MENLSATKHSRTLSIHIESEEPQKPVRIDHVWREVYELKDYIFERKFPSIVRVVRQLLYLDMVRQRLKGDFLSGKNVTDDRVHLSEASTNGIPATSDGLKALKDWVLCHSQRNSFS